jgi:LDH2 family malate/lactate/ureidoglycolate dehydrogenase
VNKHTVARVDRKASATSSAPWKSTFHRQIEFKKQIDEWIRVFRRTRPAAGTNGPLIPGGPEREAEAIRSREGIPVLKPVVNDLLDISRRTGIPFNEL